MVGYNAVKFVEHRNSGSGVMFLVFVLISKYHVIKVSCNFLGASPSWEFTTLPTLETISIVIVEV